MVGDDARQDFLLVALGSTFNAELVLALHDGIGNFRRPMRKFFHDHFLINTRKIN
jgi:hypothetical protein